MSLRFLLKFKTYLNGAYEHELCLAKFVMENLILEMMSFTHTIEERFNFAIVRVFLN